VDDDRAAALGMDARLLAEVLAEQLNLANGQTRLELEYRDGRLTIAYAHVRLNATALELLQLPRR
jgi:hypothetical protein